MIILDLQEIYKKPIDNLQYGGISYPIMSMYFDRAIKTLMAEKGIRTKQELADLSGLHVNTITNVMESTQLPLRSLPAIARALGVTPAEILRRADENYPCGVTQ